MRPKDDLHLLILFNICKSLLFMYVHRCLFSLDWTCDVMLDLRDDLRQQSKQLDISCQLQQYISRKFFVTPSEPWTLTMLSDTMQC